MDITFYGAAGTVTGSKFLLDTDFGTKVLLDCGMYQGETNEFKVTNTIPFDADSIDCVLLSHAHIDHSGLLPLLVKNGFEGKIYCTKSTADLLNIMLVDSAHIQEQDLKYVNKARHQRGLPKIEPLYSLRDALGALDLIHEIDINKVLNIKDELFVKAFPNGHILGSVTYHITVKRRNKNQTSIAFTGDIGRKNDPILNDPQPFTQADYIICESTYGDKLHSPYADTEPHLLNLIFETCVDKKGKIVIPAFSVDRTQELIYAIDKLESQGKLPPIKVYIDSPMSTRATKVMAKHQDEFNPDIKEYISKDGDPFCFKNLVYVADIEESKAINDDPSPAIIISASGMAEAGRVKHHIKNLISDSRNLILMVGYATPDSLAGRLKAGKSPVKIFGEYYEVKARVESLDYFSAHADSLEMIDYLKCQDPAFTKTVFLVHGRDEARESFAMKLKAEGFKKVVLPKTFESFRL